MAQRLLRPLYRGPLLEAARDLSLRMVPGWNAHAREVQRRNQALIESVQEVTGTYWVIDSSKLALRLHYLLENPGLEIRVIRLIRDGRAVALTYTDEWSFADASDPTMRGGGTGERRRPAQATLAAAAREWRRSNESADLLVARLPKAHWLEVRYEALCSNPRSVLEELHRFLGLAPAGIRMDFKFVEHHVVGNGMRFDRSSEIHLDDRWRTHLSADNLRVFDQVAGGLNAEYGYV